MPGLLMTAEEFIDAEVLRIAEYDSLCQRAIWKEGVRKTRRYLRMEAFIEIDCKLYELGPDSGTKIIVMEKY